MTNLLEGVTPDQIEAELIVICEKYPERTNPGCVYTDPEDPTQHCIIGQWASERGLPLPDPDSPLNSKGVVSVNMVLSWSATLEQADILNDWQEQADSDCFWGQLIDRSCE